MPDWKSIDAYKRLLAAVIAAHPEKKLVGSPSIFSRHALLDATSAFFRFHLLLSLLFIDVFSPAFLSVSFLS